VRSQLGVRRGGKNRDLPPFIQRAAERRYFSFSVEAISDKNASDQTTKEPSQIPQVAQN
jgi:hypothetical protein